MKEKYLVNKKEEYSIPTEVRKPVKDPGKEDLSQERARTHQGELWGWGGCNGAAKVTQSGSRRAG